MKGNGIGEDILRGLQSVGREAVAIAAPIARETFKRKLQQGADRYIESGEKKGGRRRGKGIGEDILKGLKQATMEAVQIAAPIAESTIRRKAKQRYEGAGRKRKGKGIGEDILRGLQSVGREAVAIAAPIARETFRRKLQQGADQYIESGEKKGGMRVRMSPAQVRTLKRGGAVQFKPIMLEDLGRYEMKVKPAVMPRLEKAFGKNLGMRLSMGDFEDVMDMKRGGSIFDAVNKVYDLGKSQVRSAVKERVAKRGVGITEDIVAAFRKKHGGGDFEDFFTRKVPSTLIRQGIPLAGTVAGAALGSYLGGPLGAAPGAITGEMAGEAVGNYVGDKTGYGLYAQRRGMGLYAVGRGVGDIIQTGSPYIDHRSPAYHPFKEKHNPFT